MNKFFFFACLVSVNMTCTQEAPKNNPLVLDEPVRMEPNPNHINDVGYMEGINYQLYYIPDSISGDAYTLDLEFDSVLERRVFIKLDSTNSRLAILRVVEDRFEDFFVRFSLDTIGVDSINHSFTSH